MKDNPALNGRSKAIAYRKSRIGNNSASATPSAAPRRRRPQAEAAAPAVAAPQTTTTRRKAVAAAPVATAAGREAAKQHRKTQVSGSRKSSASPAQIRTNPRMKAKPEPILEPRAKSGNRPAPAPVASASNSAERKKGVKKVAAAANMSQGRKMSVAWRKSLGKGRAGQDAYKSKSSQSGAVARISNPDATTREIARQVRAERCSKGGCATTGSDKGSSSQRRGRQKPVPEKVAISKTLRGQTVSGGQVGQGKMTGAETGSCKLVSGTEYLSAEEFATHCNDVPAAAPAKVSHSTTAKGQVVSGNEVGRSTSVTGDESGACQGVTGTDYLPANQSDLFCESGASKPMQTTVMPATKGNTGVTGGMSVQSSVMITNGGQRSSQNQTLKAPQKVVESRTAFDNVMTGTQVGRSAAVTGNEQGHCKNVTGTGYRGLEEVEGCNTSFPKPGNQQRFSVTPANQVVSGDEAGSVVGATGSEAGACQAVTGDSYMGMDSVAEACSTEQAQAVQSRTATDNRGNFPMSGTQTGVVGLTGAQKGACSLVTGTDYQSAEQTSAFCGSTAGRTTQAAQPGDSDFPMTMGNAGVPQSEPMQSVEAHQDGIKITGDGWDRGSKVTGTEGQWAAKRNPSMKGREMPNPMGAKDFRPTHMEEVPQSPITGSSGNTETGAKVTLSGGARA